MAGFVACTGGATGFETTGATAGLGATGAVEGVSTVLFKTTAAGGGRLKSIPEDVGAAAEAGAVGFAGEGVCQEGVKAFASARGTNAPAFGLRLNPENAAVGGWVFLSLLSCPDIVVVDE